MRQPLPSHFERGGVPKAGWGLPETDRSAGKKELRIPHYFFLPRLAFGTPPLRGVESGCRTETSPCFRVIRDIRSLL